MNEKPETELKSVLKKLAQDEVIESRTGEPSRSSLDQRQLRELQSISRYLRILVVIAIANLVASIVLSL